MKAMKHKINFSAFLLFFAECILHIKMRQTICVCSLFKYIASSYVSRSNNTMGSTRGDKRMVSSQSDSKRRVRETENFDTLCDHCV